MFPAELTTFLLSIGGIILVDLILSGDNALVIGATAARISQRRQRWLALILGGLGAVLMRVFFTISTTFLLGIPYLQAVGGLLVLVIAIRLLFDNQAEVSSSSENPDSFPAGSAEQLPLLVRRFSNWAGRRKAKRASTRNWDFWLAIGTITIADITMSLDNIVAIGALAHQQVVPLVIGLSFSIALLIIGSALVSELMNRIPGLIIIASFILAWVSADLVWNDAHSLPFIQNNPAFHFALIICFFVVVLVVTLITRVRRFRVATKSSV
ncbi:MAG TPA: YjbE family putative metal transport protein [Ktedonobacteraceae bacterium]